MLEKISHEKICQLLKKSDGRDWSFDFSNKKALLVAKSKEKTQIYHFVYTLPSKDNLSEEEFKNLFKDIDWKQAYKDSISYHIFKKDNWQKHKIYISDRLDIHFSFLIPKPIEKLFEKQNEKTTSTDDGRNK